MIDLNIYPSHFLMSGSESILQHVYHLFSFHDKAVEHQLNRHISGLDYRRRFPGFDMKQWKQTEADLKSKLQCFCGEWIGDQLEMPIGLLIKTKEYFLKHQIPNQKRDHRPYIAELEQRALKGRLTEFRPPQALAFQAAVLKGSGLIRMATGVGKTLVGQEIIRHFALSSIFLVPSKPILMQTIDRFEYAFGRKNVGMFGAGKKSHAWVTVATYQSVFNSSADDFHDYHLMIADEVHHIGADTFFACAQKRLKNATLRFGLTADEERGDGGTILVEAAVGPVIYSYECPEAIRDGYLAKPTFMIYEVNQTQGHYTKWKLVGKKRLPDSIAQSEGYDGEDAHKAYKNWILGNDLLTEKIAEIVSCFEASGKNVLVLIDEKEHGDKLMALLPNARFVIGGGIDNERILRDFNARKLKTIVATSTLGEGADTVTVDVLVNLMGGTRPKQANGRALRNDPDENGVPRKPSSLIIDFDFPNSPVLNRHSIMREEVHQTCGEVHRAILL